MKSTFQLLSSEIYATRICTPKLFFVWAISPIKSHLGQLCLPLSWVWLTIWALETMSSTSSSILIFNWKKCSIRPPKILAELYLSVTETSKKKGGYSNRTWLEVFNLNRKLRYVYRKEAGTHCILAIPDSYTKPSAAWRNASSSPPNSSSKHGFLFLRTGLQEPYSCIWLASKKADLQSVTRSGKFQICRS